MAARPIRNLLGRRPLVFVRREMTVEAAAKLMAEKNVGAVPVVDAEQVVGIFSERDLLKRVVAAGRAPAATRVEEVMTSLVLIAEADESFEACLERMKAAGCRHLPVVSGGKLVGMVSLRDLLLSDVQVKDKALKIADDLIKHSLPTTVTVELVWKCLRCGYHLQADAAPARCPHCQAPREEFVLVEED